MSKEILKPRFSHLIKQCHTIREKKLTQTIAGVPEGQRDPGHRWVVPAQSASNRRPLSPAHPTQTTARGLPRRNPPPGRDPRGRTAALGPLAVQADTAASLGTPGSDHPLPAPNSSPPPTLAKCYNHLRFPNALCSSSQERNARIDAHCYVLLPVLQTLKGMKIANFHPF